MPVANNCPPSTTQIHLNPIGPRIVNMFFHKDGSDKLFFEDFARTFAVFRPVKSSTPTYAINSREAKVLNTYNQPLLLQQLSTLLLSFFSFQLSVEVPVHVDRSQRGREVLPGGSLQPPRDDDGGQSQVSSNKASRKAVIYSDGKVPSQLAAADN